MLPWFANGQKPLFLAPMAGFTDRAFRDLCKRHGADVVLTEFVQSDALLRNVPRVWRSIALGKEQRPAGVQIFGARPDSMARAARLVVERLRPDFIDINCGCPAENVVEKNGGSGLLRRPELAADIVRAVVAAIKQTGQKTPVTVKMRLGWDAAHIVAEEFAWRVEDAGAECITVHGRTKAQGYSGEADWDAIARVAGTVSVPVIGNGDIRDAETAARRLKETGVAGLMIGRAALRSPWLFNEIKTYLRTGSVPPAPTEAERWQMFRDYAETLVRLNAAGDYAAEPSVLRDMEEHGNDGDDDDAAGDTAGALMPSPATSAGTPQNIRWLLARLLPLTHGITGSRQLRAKLSTCHTLEDLFALTPAG